MSYVDREKLLQDMRAIRDAIEELEEQIEALREEKAKIVKILAEDTRAKKALD